MSKYIPRVLSEKQQQVKDTIVMLGASKAYLKHGYALDRFGRVYWPSKNKATRSEHLILVRDDLLS